MAKGRKALVRCLASTLALTSMLGVAGCGVAGGTLPGPGNGGGNKVDETKTVINVTNFGGGIGRKWLDEAAERFETLKAEESYEAGKLGVDFSISNPIGATCVGMKGSGSHMFFLQDKYSECWGEIQMKTPLDLTELVTEETLDEYGEVGVTIESKLNENYRFAMKGLDGKYYMLPHYETQSGASYDVELFTKEGFYLAQPGKGTAYNCKLTGQTVYFTGKADEKTVGNDGFLNSAETPSYDDGMPTTLNELVAMCDYMWEEGGVVPFSVAGSHVDYTNYLIEGLWTALGGYEQRNAVVSHSGSVDYVTGISEEQLWNNISGGKKIYKPIIERAENLTSETGYKAINQAARYYAYAFIELAYHQGWIDSRYKKGTYTHKNAMYAFIFNGIGKNKKIGAHIEGSYWYNEAESYDYINQYRKQTKKDNKEIAHWNMPTSYGDNVVTDLESARKEAVINGMTSTVMINGNIANNEGLVRACKDFLKFLCTEQELQNFTACTGVSKALYDYDINNKRVQEQLDPYQLSIMHLRANNPVVHQYGNNATYRAKAANMTYSISAQGYHPTFDGVEYTSPLQAYWRMEEKGKYKNAWDCFTQTGFTETKWKGEIWVK